VAVLVALVGLGVGTIVKATAGAITVIVVYPVIVEALLVNFVPSVGKYLPFAAGNALQSPDGTKDVLSPLAGGVLFTAFAAVLLVVGGALLQSRDA
jgi:ABC-2 type transport system permease protein